MHAVWYTPSGTSGTWIDPSSVISNSSTIHGRERRCRELDKRDLLQTLGLDLGSGRAGWLPEELQAEDGERARGLLVAWARAAVLAAALLCLLAHAHLGGLLCGHAIAVGADLCARWRAMNILTRGTAHAAWWSGDTRVTFSSMFTSSRRTASGHL